MTEKLKKWMTAGLLVLVPAAAIAAGLYTNGLPTVAATTQTGVAQKPPAGVVTQLLPNGVIGTSTAPVGNPLVPVDMNLPSGGAPQTVAVSPFQIAATLAEAMQNTATSTAHAATLNTLGGLITTESLSTAAGATYTFTLTNSLIAVASPTPQVAIYSKTNTGGQMTLTSVTNESGDSVCVWTNTGTTALNGTMMVVFHL